MPRISAIVVTHNSATDIAACLDSIRKSLHPIEEIVVIDQSSIDETADRVRRQFPDVCVLDFWDNPGFGEGNNRGARVATGDYLLLLNPDATIAPDCVGHLIPTLESDPTAGVAAPKVVLAGEPSVLNSTGLNVNRIGYGWDRGYLEWDEGQYDRAEPVVAVSGCAMLIRADTFRELGGFDASYFLYYEDLDLCRRSWIMGKSVRYVPAAVARHAMRVFGRPEVYNEYLDHRNRLLTLLKSTPARSFPALVPTVLRFEIRTLLEQLRRRRWLSVARRFHAWFWNLQHLRQVLSRRRVIWTNATAALNPSSDYVERGDGWPRVRAAVPDYPPVYEHTVDAGTVGNAFTMGVNDIGALGLGWHAVESLGGVQARWTCGYGIAFLRVPDDCRRASLIVSCAVLEPTEVTVTLARHPCGRFLLSSSWQSLRIEVPVQATLVRVELRVNTFVPSERDPRASDHRTLGIAVSEMRLTC